MVVGFAGSGNMGAALARGWSRASLRPTAMLFTDSGSGRARQLAAEVGGESLESIEDMAGRADLVVLAVKPAALEGVALPAAYQHGLDDTLRAVAQGRATAAVLVRPVSLAEIERTAREGLLMPPKSTFFTPKLKTGAVLRPLAL